MVRSDGRVSVKESPWIESQWLLLDGETYARIEAKAKSLGQTPSQFLEEVIEAILSGRTHL